MGFGDGGFAIMEDGGGEDSARMALCDALDEMLEIADTARGYDRNGYGICNGAGEREIIAVARAIAVHGGDEQFACAKSGELDGMAQGINAGSVASTVGEYLPATFCDFAGVDGGGDALAAKAFGYVGDDFRA